MFCITGLLNLMHSPLTPCISGQSVGKPVDQLHKGHETEAKAQPPEPTNLSQNDICFVAVVLH